METLNYIDNQFFTNEDKKILNDLFIGVDFTGQESKIINK